MDLFDTAVYAFPDLHSGLKPPKIKFQFAADDFVGLGCFTASLHRHGQLLPAERKQHAEDDNPNLADKLAPAMQWRWQVKVHEMPLTALPLSDELMSTMGGKRTLMAL